MINRVVASNFLSWKDLDRTITPGVTLIDGWNEDDQTSEGSGKSAILNAICWALYGKIPKDANIDDVIKEGEKSCHAEVWFTDGTVIRRSRKPNELVMLKYDGEGFDSVKGKDARETQTLIEEYVALTFETFCQTIYFAQGYTKKFITANQEDKGKILSEVQDLTVFDKAGKEVRSLIKMEEDAVTKLKHSKDLASKDIELTKRDITAQETAFDTARAQQAQQVKFIQSQILSLETQHKTAYDQQVQRIRALNVQAQEAEASIADFTETKNRTLAEVQALVYDESMEKHCQGANNLLMSQAGAIQAELAGIDKLVAKRTNAEAQGKRYAARYKQLLVDKQKNLDFVANPTQNCPTCNTKLADCDTSHAQAEVARIDEELASIVETLNLLSAEIDAPIPTKESLNAQLAEIGQQRLINDTEIQNCRNIKDRLTRVAANLSALDRQIAEAQSRLLASRAKIITESVPLVIDTAPLEALNAKLAQAQMVLVFDTGPLEALNAKLTTLSDNLEDFERLIAEKNRHLTKLENLKIGFKEIKSHVFNSMLNEINGRVHKYLSHLFEVPVSVRFRNEDMKIETDVRYDGVERGLGLLSGGQFRRVSLAVDLALSDVITSRKGARVGVLILDEYFKDLSESSMEKCLTLLEGRGQPVLLIEHNSIFKNIVNNSIMVRLEDGTSSVKV